MYLTTFAPLCHYFSNQRIFLKRKFILMTCIITENDYLDMTFQLYLKTIGQTKHLNIYPPRLCKEVHGHLLTSTISSVTTHGTILNTFFDCIPITTFALSSHLLATLVTTKAYKVEDRGCQTHLWKPHPMHVFRTRNQSTSKSIRMSMV